MLCRMLCRRDSRKRVRTPTCDEMNDGVPEWFMVEMCGGRKTFVSREGERFDSISALKRWRENHVCMDEPSYY